MSRAYGRYMYSTLLLRISHTHRDRSPGWHCSFLRLNDDTTDYYQSDCAVRPIGAWLLDAFHCSCRSFGRDIWVLYNICIQIAVLSGPYQSFHHWGNSNKTIRGFFPSEALSAASRVPLSQTADWHQHIMFHAACTR